MGLITKVAQIDKKFGWSFMGFVLAAIFGGIAIYTEFVRDTSPVVRYEILSNTRILDVKEDVSGLSIVYNAEDIRKSRKTLSVLLINVSNRGRSAILKSHYDSDAPLGLSINSGEIIKAEVTTATTEYLKKNIGIRVTDSSNVALSQIIIEPDESFTLKLLVLSPEESRLTVLPKGKIAGVRNLLLIDRSADEAKESFFMKVVSGSLWVQVARIAVYVIAFILLLIIIIAPAAYISDKREEIKKNRVVRQYKSKTDSASNEMNVEVYEFYNRYGLTAMRRMKKVLVDDKEFQSFLRKCDVLTSESGELNEPNDSVTIVGQYGAHPRIITSPGFLLNSMLRLGLISKTGGSYTRNEERIKAMNDFVRFAAAQKSSGI